MLRVGRYGARLIKAQSLTARCSYSALAITDPLVIYENKIANKSLLRDEAQHRAAIELVFPQIMWIFLFFFQPSDHLY